MNANGKLEVKVAPEMNDSDELDSWCWNNINNAKLAERLVDKGRKWFNANCAGKTNAEIAEAYIHWVA